VNQEHNFKNWHYVRYPFLYMQLCVNFGKFRENFILCSEKNLTFSPAFDKFGTFLCFLLELENVKGEVRCSLLLESINRLLIGYCIN